MAGKRRVRRGGGWGPIDLKKYGLTLENLTMFGGGLAKKNRRGSKARRKR